MSRFRADSDQIKQILTNLVNNAIKFSDNGTQIKLAIRNIGDYVEFSVSDQGKGIDKDHLEKIFKKLYRVNTITVRDTRGSGPGLPIAKYLVEQHGGSILVNSKIGTGLQFSFTISKKL